VNRDVANRVSSRRTLGTSKWREKRVRRSEPKGERRLKLQGRSKHIQGKNNPSSDP